MNILAIRFARLGDVALLLPVLQRMKTSFPGSRLSLLTGHRCAPLARMCPAIDEVISVDRVALKEGPAIKAIMPIGRLAVDLRRRRFDAVVDFHGLRETGLLAWISGARRRLGLKRWGQSSLAFCYNLPPVIEDKSLHVSRMFSIVADRLSGSDRQAAESEDLGPILTIPEDTRQWWRRERAAGGDSPNVALNAADGGSPNVALNTAGGDSPCVALNTAGGDSPYVALNTAGGGSPYVALNIDAPVKERLWPLDRFAAMGDAMIERCGARVVALAGPGKSHLIQQYLQMTRHPDRTSGLSDLPISHLAAIIESAAVFVSNDTGPMHLGALVHTPTVGLFSVGLPEHFRPIGPHGDFLRANPIDRLEVADVLKRVEAMWVVTGSGLRR